MGDETEDSGEDSTNSWYDTHDDPPVYVPAPVFSDPFAGISGYNADGFGGTPKPTIASETPGSESYIPGINGDAYGSQYGTSKGADYIYDNTGVVRGVGSSSIPSKLSGLAKQAKDAFSGKLDSWGGIADLFKMLMALKYATSGGMKPNVYRTAPIDMTRKAVQPNNVIPTRAYGAGAVGQPYQATTYAAEGGIMGLAKGGTAKPPRYLDGPTDGMADKINTDIDGKQAAKLSHGEFVIPADVVSHLGNGNSKAGADVLYKMMDRVRHARTGNKKQGKQINPAKFMPGGIAGYAGGGAVAFSNGGTTPTTPTAPAAGSTVESNLSPWAAPYVTDMLGKANALSNQPYQAYTGQLTAGTSPLQTQAFDAYSNLNTTYNPVGGTFTGQTAQQYMNPYLSATLNSQLEEFNRQSQIAQMGQQAKLAQAGALGGSRDAIMRAENLRNLGQQQSNLINTTYSQAYDKAMGQFNTEQEKKINEAQFGAKYGIDALNAQQQAGAQQRGIEQQALDAQRAQFEEARAYPYKQLEFQKSMLSGMPIDTRSSSANTSSFEDLMKSLNAIFGPLAPSTTQGTTP